FCLRGIEPSAKETHQEFGIRLPFLHTQPKRIDQTVDLRNRIPADGTKSTRLAEISGKNASEVGSLMIPRSKHTEIVPIGLPGRAHQETVLGIVFRDLTRFALNCVRFADDQLRASFGVLPKCTRIITVRNSLGEDIVDLAIGRGLL